MLNILHLINHAGNGGSEKYIKILVNELNSKKINTFLLFNNSGLLSEDFQKNNIFCEKFSMNHFFDFKAAYKLALFCNKYNINIIHTHFLRENSIAVLSKIFGNKTKIINTVHMLNKNNRKVIFFNKILSFFNKNIIAVSNSVFLKLVVEGISKNKLQLINNGVEIENFENFSVSSLRKELNFNKNDFVITSISRFTEEKGHKFYLHAIKEFMDKYLYLSNIKFLLVGDGKLLDECKQLSKELKLDDFVVFLGYRIDIENILKDTDLFVLHSKFEAFGLSVIEALASNVPVVATKSGGPEEILNTPDKVGILIENENINDLVFALNKLINDVEFYNICKKNSLPLVRDNYNSKSMAIKTMFLYSKRD